MTKHPHKFKKLFEEALLKNELDITELTGITQSDFDEYIKPFLWENPGIKIRAIFPGGVGTFLSVEMK